MTVPTIPEPPVLVTIPNVELIEVGFWPKVSTGPITITPDDLASIVAALDDPAIHTPVVKLGHTDPRFDGEPAVGRVENLQIVNDGMTLVGDFVGVPKWIADIMGSAFPNRSFEGEWQVHTPSGNTHALVMTAVALLGVHWPAIETLDDIAALYEIAAEQPHGDKFTLTLSSKEQPMPPTPIVAASISVEDVRREYYDSLDQHQTWWWIRCINVEPTELIVDDDEGSLYRVPFTIGTDETITFADPIEVVIVYQDAPASVAAAAQSRRPPLATFASRTEARPDAPERGQEGESEMDLNTLRTSLGLPDDASEEDVNTKIEELKAAAETPPEPDTKSDEPVETPKVELPDGVVAIDADQLEELKVSASKGEAAHKQLADQERDTFLTGAVRAGKFPPARREHYASLWDKDPEGTREFVDTLAAGAIPVEGRELGHGQHSELSDDAIWAGIAGMSRVVSTENKEA